MVWNPLAYSDSLAKAAQGLLIAGIVALAYKTARNAKVSRWTVIWQGFLWCAGFSLFAAAVMGQPTCVEQGDPLHGTCEQYADDAYNPTFNQRAGRFWYFLVLLYVPVSIAAFSDRDGIGGVRQTFRSSDSDEQDKAGPGSRPG